MAHGQMRDFAADNALKSPKPLSFERLSDLIRACRHFDRAFPITEDCFSALNRATRHLRRRLRIRRIGDGPKANSDYIPYEWPGRGTVHRPERRSGGKEGGKRGNSGWEAFH